MTRRALNVVLAVALLALPACGKKEEPLPDSIPALRDVAARDRDAAKAARWAKKPKEADVAALHAEAASKKAGELLAKNAAPPDEELKARSECAAAAREARREARFADEEKRLEEVRSGFKAKAYRMARKAAWAASCAGMAAAADKATGKDIEELPDSVRDMARVASGLATRVSGRARLPDGKPDWPGIASDIRGMSGEVPPEASRDLAIAFMILGKNDIALWELEMADPAKLPNDDDRTAFHLVRGIIFSRLGMPLLAGEEINRAPAIAGGPAAGYGNELLAGIHLALGFMYLQQKDNESADREIALSIQAWPDNPVAVFLTGERLAENGEYEKAAESMEAASKGTEGEWLAERIAKRARDVRDHPGESPSLVHDKEFQREVVFHYLAIAAKKSPAAAKANAAILGAERMGKMVLGHLPGN
ncbi:MAG: hypothetical protein FD180_3238 [Planctomycetota bacterium]|nr:MAG: hypothetical protein FD180_3238 [Planctomycetota bacterium]